MEFDFNTKVRKQYKTKPENIKSLTLRHFHCFFDADRKHCSAADTNQTLASGAQE